MCDTISSYLEVASIEALETSCFLFADLEVSVDEFAEPECVIRAAVDFSGPRQGTFAIECDVALLPEIAGNMLGDSDAPSALQYDALGELANIICGSVLPHLSDEPRFAIGAPAVQVAEQQAMPARAQAALCIDGRSVRAYLDWSRQHCTQ